MAPARQDSSGTMRTRRHSPTFLFLMRLSHATEPIRAEFSAPCCAHQVLHGCSKRSQLWVDKEERKEERVEGRKEGKREGGRGRGSGERERERIERTGKKNVATYLKINSLYVII